MNTKGVMVAMSICALVGSGRADDAPVPTAGASSKPFAELDLGLDGGWLLDSVCGEPGYPQKCAGGLVLGARIDAAFGVMVSRSNALVFRLGSSIGVSTAENDGSIGHLWFTVGLRHVFSDSSSFAQLDASLDGQFGTTGVDVAGGQGGAIGVTLGRVCSGVLYAITIATAPYAYGKHDLSIADIGLVLGHHW